MSGSILGVRVIKVPNAFAALERKTSLDRLCKSPLKLWEERLEEGWDFLQQVIEGQQDGGWQM
ncbi:MAG: hypothetical protein LQ352_003613 [Teloschistes flavicans]|nr:MAG: hypothetical protein LQ352_003613 [Teloschistes flavicans]